MPTVIGELATLITARTAPFEKAMGRARKSTTDFQTSLKNVALGVLSIQGSMIAFQQVAGRMQAVIAGVNAELQRIDQIAKTGQRLDLDFTDLTALKEAAEEAGISFPTVEKAFQRMEKQIGNAKRGVGESVKVFEELVELGLDFEDLANKTPFEQFVAISEAIRQMDTHAERLSATIKIFESEGADMVRMLGLGEAGFAEALAKVELFGNALDEDTVKSIQDTNDALRDMAEITASIKTGFAVELSTLFKDIAEITKFLGITIKPGTFGEILGAVTKGVLFGGTGAGVVGFAGSVAEQQNADVIGERAAQIQEERFGTKPPKPNEEEKKQTSLAEKSLGVLKEIVKLSSPSGRAAIRVVDSL